MKNWFNRFQNVIFLCPDGTRHIHHDHGPMLTTGVATELHQKLLSDRETNPKADEMGRSNLCLIDFPTHKPKCCSGEYPRN